MCAKTVAVVKKKAADPAKKPIAPVSAHVRHYVSQHYIQRHHVSRHRGVTSRIVASCGAIMHIGIMHGGIMYSGIIYRALYTECDPAERSTDRMPANLWSR